MSENKTPDCRASRGLQRSHQGWLNRRLQSIGGHSLRLLALELSLGQFRPPRNPDTTQFGEFQIKQGNEHAALFAHRN